MSYKVFYPNGTVSWYAFSYYKSDWVQMWDKVIPIPELTTFFFDYFRC